MISRNLNSYFSYNPTLMKKRSKFKMPCNVKTSFNAGELVPLRFIECLPGDSIKLTTGALLRMTSALDVPVMDDMVFDLYAFAVPVRLIWPHIEELFGANNNTAYEPKVNYEVPTVTWPSGGWNTGTVADHFGVPVGVTSDKPISALPFRAYCKIWNDWFRSEIVSPEMYFDKGDAQITGSNGTNFVNNVVDRGQWKASTSYSVGDLVYYNYNTYYCSTAHTSSSSFDSSKFTLYEGTSFVSDCCRGGKCAPVYKFFDCFTSCLPEQQRGEAVTLPLGTSAPVEITAAGNGTSDFYLKGQTSGKVTAVKQGTISSSLGKALIPYSNDLTEGEVLRYHAGLSATANLEQATAATINQLREAMMVQKIYESDNRSGTRYISIIKAQWGVDSSDARLQRSEYLGGIHVPIDVFSVSQTTTPSTGSLGDSLGKQGAFSITGDVNETFFKSFEEHSLIIILGCVRHVHSYAQGLEKYWSKTQRFDFYTPLLDGLGDQPVLNKELYVSGTSTDDEVFGYQEYAYEYRYLPSIVSGMLRPNVNYGLQSWTLADNYASTPVLGAQWLAESKNEIDRVCVVDSTVSDQFIADFKFEVEAVREMPLYNIPGMGLRF